MTVIARIRYYKDRVAYPTVEQLRVARSSWDLDGGERPTDEIDHVHIQRIQVFGRDAEDLRMRERVILDRFFDSVGRRPGFRVLTHETQDPETRGSTVTHEIVYAIESRPTRGYVRLTLKSDVERGQASGVASGIFGQENMDRMSRLFDQLKRE